MESLLLKSIQDGRVRQTGLLLKVGKDVNEQNRKGETGLMKAMALKNPQIRMNIIKMLIKSSADVSKCDSRRRNAFMWACYYGRIEEIKYMISTRDLYSLQVDNQDYNGNTALFYAASMGHTKLVSELVNYLHENDMQSVLSTENSYGITPLMEAFRNGDFETAKCLLNDGKVEIDDLTYNMLHNDDFEITWSKKAPQKLMTEIIKNLSGELDPEPSNILRLLITNESFRNVALKIRNGRGNQTERRQNKPSLKVPKTAPGRLPRGVSDKSSFDNKKTISGLRRAETEVRKSSQKSIKGMLPTIMNMYEEQLSQNYRPASKNEFVPYASVSKQLKNTSTTTIVSTASTKVSKNTLGTLPDFSRMTKLLDPRFSRSSRSVSVQLPQMNSWSLLRKKLKSNLMFDI